MLVINNSSLGFSAYRYGNLLITMSNFRFSYAIAINIQIESLRITDQTWRSACR